MRRIPSTIFRALVLLAVSWFSSASVEAAAAAPAALRVRPEKISVGMFYSGGSLQLDGMAPAGNELALVLLGETEDLKLKKKEKILGLLWMNRGEVAFENIPSFYAVSSSRALKKLAPRAELNRLGIGFEAFSSEPSKQGANGDSADHFSDLVKLKKKEHMFMADERGITIDRRDKKGEHWKAVLSLPSKLLPGKYRVQLFAFRNGAGKLIGSRTLSVRQVGMAAFIHSLAEQHGLLYGICAVIIALIVGVLTGLAFGLGSKGGH